jgi:hypothetical protein
LWVACEFHAIYRAGDALLLFAICLTAKAEYGMLERS